MPLTPATWLSEFTVNLTTNELQARPRITHLANGNILVVWDSVNDTGAGSAPNQDVIGQLFTPLGERIGGEFAVNAGFTEQDERAADVAALASGGFVTVYEDFDNGAITGSIRLTRRDADGLNPVNVTIANDTTLGAGPSEVDPTYFSPRVAIGSASSVLVVYQENELGSTESRIVGRIYNPQTNTVGSEISLINIQGTNIAASVTVLENGNYVIAAATTTLLGDEVITYRIISATGSNVLGVVQFGETIGDLIGEFAPTVTALTGGGFVIAWVEGVDVVPFGQSLHFQRFDANGVAQGNVTQVFSFEGGADSLAPVMVQQPDGGFIVFWDDVSDLVGRRYDATGAAVGNTFTVAASNGAESLDAELLADGRVAISFVNANGEIGMTIIDTRDFANDPAVYTPQGWQIGTILADTITGTAGADMIAGNNGDDTINGGGGGDTLHGGEGNDRFETTGDGFFNQNFGDGGDDTFALDNQHYFGNVDGGAGSGDHLDGSATVDFVLTIDLVAQTYNDTGGTFALQGVENVTGGQQADIITGDGGANIIDGQDGADTITGGGSADVLRGGNGDDTFVYLSNSDITAGESIDGGAGTGDEILLRINPTGYYDFRSATITGVERLRFDGQNFVSLTGSQIGAGAITQVTGDAAVNQLYIYGAAINLSGVTFSGWTDASDDIGINGTSGADSQTGSSRADVFRGSNGADVLNGGGGNDTFRYFAASDLTAGEIINGGTGTADRIELWGIVSFDFTLAAISGVEQLAFAYGAGGFASLLGTQIGTGKITSVTGDDGENIINVAGAAVNLSGVTFSGWTAGTDIININGTAAADNLTGSSQRDVITGGNGADTLDGGGGVDVLIGGDGGDVYIIDSTTDTITEDFGGTGIDEIRCSISFNFGVDNIEQITLTGTGDTLAFGSDRAERIVGNTGSNRLDGYAGADTLEGGDGADTLYGDSGADRLLGGNGDDTLEGGADIDTLFGGAGNDTFIVRQGEDAVGTETYDGGGDIDELGVSGGGAFDLRSDSILSIERLGFGSGATNVLLNANQFGAAGILLTSNIFNASATTHLKIDMGAVSIFNLSGLTLNPLNLQPFRITITGDTNSETITGANVATILNGNAGNDRLRGGLGNDTLNGGSNTAAGDTADFSLATAALTLTLDANGNGSTGLKAGIGSDTFTGIENLIGSTGADQLTGNALNNTLAGGAGIDTLIGGSGRDVLNGGLGADQLFGGLDNDQHIGGDGAGIDYARYDDANYGNLTIRLDGIANVGAAALGDTYIGIEGLVGGLGNDTVAGNALANFLFGGGGNDFILGLGGVDYLNGGLGGDNLYGGAGADQHIGGDDAGLDFARYDDANHGNLVISLITPATNTGAALGDTYSGIEGLVGGLGNDVVIGNNSANYLFGSGGLDFIDALGGNDHLFGGASADKFRFSTALSAATNVDFVHDFVHSTDDLLLKQTIFTSIGTALSATELRLGTVAADANDFIIYNSATGQIFYDANGNGAGGQTLFARMNAGTVLDAGDFVMV